MKKILLLVWGIMAGIGSLLTEIVLSFFFESGKSGRFAMMASDLLFPVVVAPLIEECLRFLMIRKTSEFQPLSYKDRLAASAWIGFGFGLAEISLSLLLGQPEAAPFSWWLTPPLLVHILAGVITGAFFFTPLLPSWARNLAFLPALLAHSAFNYWIITH